MVDLEFEFINMFFFFHPLSIVAGVKVKYPSCYVLVTDIDDSTANFYGTPGPSVKNSNQPVSGKRTRRRWRYDSR